VSGRRLRRRKSGLNPIFIAIIFLFLLACAIVGAIMFHGRTDDSQSSETIEAPDYDNPDKWSEGIITYQNQKYRYNKNVRTYLFMGIDTDEPVHKAEDGISGGQADALFLLVADKAADKLSVIAIHRNTMTTVKMYNREGEYVGDAELQICLQHGYGDGERTSCQRTADCVENLFYNIPINGYLSLNMGGIGLLNDAIGGVELTVLETIDSEKLDVHLTEGETKVLNGNEAYVYVRSRDVSEFNSATDRLERQEQYLNILLPKMLKKMRSASKAASVYGEAEDYIYSNINFSRFSDELSEMSYDPSESMYNVPGEVVMGERLEEFYVDDKGLYELILDVFYEKLDA
jgi:LCP family protein required for cell wall assembly